MGSKHPQCLNQQVGRPAWFTLPVDIVPIDCRARNPSTLGMTTSSPAPASPWTLSGKTCVITGFTQGIGRVTATELARTGARLLLVARDRDRGTAVLEAIKKESGNPHIEFLIADLSRMADVRKLAADIQARTDRLDVLINNAGAMFMQRQVTVDGHEMTFAVNHLAYFLLTTLLLDLIKGTAQTHGAARIINVASRAHKRAGQVPFDDLMHTRGYSGFPVYCRSKLANILFTYELARRLEASGVRNVTVNCLHPGVIGSGFGLNNGGLYALLMKVAGPFMQTPEEGARTTIYLATSPDVSGITGTYFDKCQPKTSSRESQDAGAAARLWQVSEQLVGTAAATGT